MHVDIQCGKKQQGQEIAHLSNMSTRFQQMATDEGDKAPFYLGLVRIVSQPLRDMLDSKCIGACVKQHDKLLR